MRVLFRSAVGVDVADVRWVDAGVTDRVAHAARAALAVLAGRGHVERVAAHAETGELGVDARATRLGALVFLDHQDSGAVAHDEAVAALVPRPRCLLRPVVAGSQRLHRAESADGRGRGRGLGAAGAPPPRPPPPAPP